MNKHVLMFFFFLFISGCANPYAKFYNDRTGGADISKLSHLIPSVEEPRLISGNNQESDYLQMLEDGYALIGYSSFNGADVNENDALRHAVNVHASVVLIY